MRYNGHVYTEALSADYVSVTSAGALGIGARSKRAIVAHTLFRVDGQWVSRECVDHTCITEPERVQSGRKFLEHKPLIHN